MTRTPALQRQRSGARGGRAARRSARYKQRDQLCLDHATPSLGSPDTPPFSDMSDCGLDNYEFHPVFRSCPLTPLEGQPQLVNGPTYQLQSPTWISMDFNYNQPGYGVGNHANMQNLLLRPSDSQGMSCIGDVQSELSIFERRSESEF